MSNISNIPISHYKVLSLPSRPEANSVYYLLDQNSDVVKGYITSKNGIAIPLFNVNSGSGNGNVVSVTGTGVTGTTTNPVIDIATFVSNQLGNLVHLSVTDGKLSVNPITSPDNSIEVTQTSTELQLQISEEIRIEIEGKEDKVNKQNSLTKDGTGIKYITVDAVNEAFLRNTKLFARTGIATKNDQFELAVFDLNTVTIKACDMVVFWEELFVVNAVSNDAFKTFPQKNYPLSQLVTATGGNINKVPIVADGVYIRYIAYDKNGNVVSSPTDFIESNSVAQLGFVTVIKVGGTVSFLGGITPGARNVFSQPILANLNELDRITNNATTDISINYNVGTPSLKSNPGTITGISINWRGVNNVNNTSPIDKFSYLGDSIVDFVSIDPKSLTQATPFVFHTLWTEIDNGVAVNNSFFNTTTQLRDTLTAGTFAVKRVMIGVRGGIFIQESEFTNASAAYTTIDAAKANVFTHEFTDSIVPPGLVMELARIIYQKGVTDFSDPNKFFIVVTAGGGSGGGISSVGDATTVTKGIIQLAGDLGGTALAPTVPGKEDKSNKTTNFTVVNDTLYPSIKATKDYVDSKIPTDYSKVVYVNDVSPTTATIFDLSNPPVTNNNTLKNDVNNLYIGTDASTWVYNGTSLTYVTKIISSTTSNFFLAGTSTDAGNTKTGAIERTGTVGVGTATAANHAVTKAQLDTKGDMTTTSNQDVTGIKTFFDGRFGMRNVANTFTSFFTNLATASRTWTLPDISGILALVSFKINSQAGITYTYTLNDTIAKTIIPFTSSSPVTATIPTNASVTIPIGSEIKCVVQGAGAVTVGGAGITLVGKNFIFSQGDTFYATKIATDTWSIDGNALKGTSSQFRMGDDTLISAGSIFRTRKDITGTTYTLLSSDVDKILYTTNSSPITITIPSGLTVNQSYEIFQYAAGQVTFVGSSTTLLYSSYEQPKTAELYCRVLVEWVDVEKYQLYGELAAY